MKDLFAADPRRVEKFSLCFQDILVDYSKNRITPETMKLLLSLAEEVDLQDAVGEDVYRGQDQRDGKKGRSACGLAESNPTSPIYVDGQDVMPRGECGPGKDEEASRRE